MYINVHNLTKHFKIKVRDKGLSNAIKAFVKPRYRIVKAVDDISFGIDKGEILGFITVIGICIGGVLGLMIGHHKLEKKYKK